MRMSKTMELLLAFQAFAKRVAEDDNLFRTLTVSDFFVKFKVAEDVYLKEEIHSFIAELLELLKLFDK